MIAKADTVLAFRAVSLHSPPPGVLASCAPGPTAPSRAPAAMPPQRRLRSFPIDPYFAIGVLAALLVGAAIYAKRSGSPGPLAEVPATVLAELKSLKLMETAGPAGARVKVVEVGDYECPACAAAHEKTWPVIQRYLRDGSVSFSAYDLPLPSHRNAIPAAVAAGCTAAQSEERFWSYRDRLFRNRDRWVGAYPVEPALVRLAAEAGADTAALRSCVEREGSQRAEALTRAWTAASAEGVRAIPAWTVNGKTVAWPDLEPAIRNALEEAR